VLATGQREGQNRDIAQAHWLKVAGGKLHFRTSGSGPLVICLHGWTLDWRIWLPQLPLAQDLHLVMPDRRGFGCSTAPPGLADECEDVEAIADHFGAEEFSLIGLSQGAAVALDVARNQPSRVEAAVLIGAPLHGLEPESIYLTEIDRAAYSAKVRSGKLSEMLAEWRQHPLTKVSLAGRKLLDEILDDYDGRDQLVEQAPLSFSQADIGGLKMPLLAIAGENDSGWRKDMTRFIAASAAHGSGEIVASAGHLANVDQPEKINALLKDFLSAHRKRGN
jgi:pimeloyl-ACP methyl ester carboxylesterase